MESRRALGSLGGARADDTIPLSEARRPEKLSSVAYEAIREAIINRRLAPGQRLTEVELGRKLNVSKTPVREALLRLRQVGLIEDDGSRGGRVIRPSARRLRDAYQLREALEALTARVAAEQGSDDQRREIQATARKSVEAAAAANLEQFRHWDHEFHLAIAAAAGNTQIAKLLDDAMALIAALVERDIGDVETSVDAGRSHLRIAEAIARSRPGEAADHMHTHLRHAGEHMLEGLERTQGLTLDDE